MSTIALAIAPNDIAVVNVPSSAPEDKRILTAEEMALGQRILVQPDARIESGWTDPPVFTFVDDWVLRIMGTLQSSLFRRPLSIGCDVTIPFLPDTTSVVSRDDFLSLVVFVVEVGLAQDPSIRITDVEPEMDQNGNLTGLVKTNFDGENTRRYRLFWGMIYSQSSKTEADFWNALTVVDAVSDSLREIAIANGDAVATEGFLLGDMQFYPCDINLVKGMSYSVVNSLIQVFPVCSIHRMQNYLLSGYVWGNNGEEALSVDFTIKPLFKRIGGSVETRLKQRVNEILRGVPGYGFCYTRAVKNLLGGSVSFPGDQPGELTRSPSGSYIIANGQRVSFTNQKILQDYFCQVVWSQYDTGSNRVLLTASADIDSPVSTQFADASYHRIFDENGVDQTDFGDFIAQDGYNTVTWVAGSSSSFYASNSGAFVSKKAYFIPAIYFASGSGFSEFFVTLEKAWNNGSEISFANIRDGENDLTQYTEPSGGEVWIVIHGKERSAIHYIYKKISVTSSSTGVIAIPDSIGGNFAFVQGKSFVEDGITKYRFNNPILTGLPPSQSVNALVYYPPKSAGDDWQFQLKVSPYQGVGAGDGVAFLDGSTVVSSNYFFVHTLGGGGSCFWGDATLRRCPSSFLLPAVLGGVQCFDLNAPVHLAGQGYPGPVSFQEMPAIAGVGVALPCPGMTIYAVPTTVIAHPRSLNVVLFGGDNVTPLGFGTPTFAKSDDAFQFVLSFVVEKEGEKRIVIATHNGLGGLSYALDSSALTAIDLFYL